MMNIINKIAGKFTSVNIPLKILDAKVKATVEYEVETWYCIYDWNTKETKFIINDNDIRLLQHSTNDDSNDKFQNYLELVIGNFENENNATIDYIKLGINQSGIYYTDNKTKEKKIKKL